MINYDYICQACDHELENVLQSIKDKPKKRCPKCGKHKLERVLHGGVYGFVNNASTVGQLADKNTRDMGHYQKSEIEAKAKENKPKSTQTIYGKYATASKSEINKMTPQQQQNYIMRGNK
jgi:putative FmdB family regulatory protein